MNEHRESAADLMAMPLEQLHQLPGCQCPGDQTSEMAWCEHPSHGPKAHPATPECIWPHLVGPSGPTPIVGHPLTVHD